jgi:hypothetical protein
MDDTKPTKLTINLKDGIIQAEGDEAFVRDVYNDFKEVVSKRVVTTPVLPSAPPALEQEPGADETKEVSKASTTPAKAKGKRQSPTADAFKPKFDNDLDLAGIDEFVAAYSPSNNSERILVFTAFLRDKLGKATCTAHEIYTCYFVTKQKIPEAFVQAFRDCQGRTHYIKYTTMTDIEIAIPGQNWLNGQGKKQAPAE